MENVYQFLLYHIGYGQIFLDVITTEFPEGGLYFFMKLISFLIFNEKVFNICSRSIHFVKSFSIWRMNGQNRKNIFHHWSLYLSLNCRKDFLALNVGESDQAKGWISVIWSGVAKVGVKGGDALRPPSLAPTRSLYLHVSKIKREKTRNLGKCVYGSEPFCHPPKKKVWLHHW